MVAVVESLLFLAALVAGILYIAVYFAKLFLTATKTPDGDSVMNRLLGQAPAEEEFEATWPDLILGWLRRRQRDDERDQRAPSA